MNDTDEQQYSKRKEVKRNYVIVPTSFKPYSSLFWHARLYYCLFVLYQSQEIILGVTLSLFCS